MKKRIAHLRSASQAGFTLVEILVVCLLLAVVIGAITTPLIVSANAGVADSNYSYAQEQARAGLDAMVSQIRQATSILSTTPNSIEMYITLHGTALEVYYECDIAQSGTSYRECIRVQAAQGATLPALTSGAVVLSNLTNATSSSPVFTFYPTSVSPYYMTATVDVPASHGAHGGLTNSIAFSDGALMRNLDIGN